jgi:hypothetical protein
MRNVIEEANESGEKNDQTVEHSVPRHANINASDTVKLDEKMA